MPRSLMASSEGSLSGLFACKESHVNNCPSCKKVISELKLSRIKGKDKVPRPFDCVTLCCPFKVRFLQRSRLSHNQATTNRVYGFDCTE